VKMAGDVEETPRPGMEREGAAPAFRSVPEVEEVPEAIDEEPVEEV